ncbi:hypothetical protein J2T13_002005 [Paenibacillus sp. DS2015]|uniref:hypothetical protein n=1 Tax=Paenibacillus sp. DS2015 TaxID=3373917 RepID=UPI003D21BDEE
MSVNSALQMTLIIALSMFILLYGVLSWVRSRERNVEQSVLYGRGGNDKIRYRERGHAFLQSSYSMGLRIPLLSHYIRRMRKRLSGVHAYDEFHLRHEVMKMTYAVLGTLGLSVVLLFMVNQSISFLLTVILAAIVLNSFLVDTYVNSLEKRLLSQMVDLFSDVRHRYHQHGMVEEALYEAAETAGYEVSLHTNKIYESLTSKNPDEQLELYYEAAPNRFLKAFAGISYMIMEFGDKTKEQGSIYLQGLSSLSKEIHLEILRRDKLDYLLKGLNIIALAPIFFTKPIESWARNSFPAMDQFYMSKVGYITKISIFVIIIVAYMLLQKLQQNDETTYRTGKSKKSWEQIVSSIRVLSWVTSLVAPKPQTRPYGIIIRLLKDTNSTLRYEWFYIRRIVFFMVGFALTLTTILFLHHSAREHIMYDPVKSDSFFGRLSIEEKRQGDVLAASDRKVMERVDVSPDASYDQVALKLIEMNEKPAQQDQFVASVQRILDKLQQYNEEYVKWWEVLLAFMMGAMGYQLPLWILYFQKKVRTMDMRHEVYQFHTVISMLRDMDRMSVETILEWMDRFAVIFKTPIHKGLLHYDHGAEMALQGLKDEILFPEFQRIIDKLLLAVDKIPITQAFDDLESEMSFYFEQRKQEYERIIDTKAGWGRMIGFAPMYALIFLYLVIPLISMSFMQMSMYYEQIQHL